MGYVLAALVGAVIAYFSYLAILERKETKAKALREEELAAEIRVKALIEKKRLEREDLNRRVAQLVEIKPAYEMSLAEFKAERADLLLTMEALNILERWERWRDEDNYNGWNDSDESNFNRCIYEGLKNYSKGYFIVHGVLSEQKEIRDMKRFIENERGEALKRHNRQLAVIERKRQLSAE